jgi:hypothetical protein
VYDDLSIGRAIQHMAFPLTANKEVGQAASKEMGMEQAAGSEPICSKGIISAIDPAGELVAVDYPSGECGTCATGKGMGHMTGEYLGDIIYRLIPRHDDACI